MGPKATAHFWRLLEIFRIFGNFWRFYFFFRDFWRLLGIWGNFFNSLKMFPRGGVRDGERLCVHGLPQELAAQRERCLVGGQPGMADRAGGQKLGLCKQHPIQPIGHIIGVLIGSYTSLKFL